MEIKLFDNVTVISHISYRVIDNTPLEGPYSSVCNSLSKIKIPFKVCLLPLNGFLKPIHFGDFKKRKKIQLPDFLGYITPFKFLIDFIIIIFFVFANFLFKKNNRRLVIGIDPLSCLPLILLKPIFQYKLIFYCVDFNKTRFKNIFLQKCYEKADEWSSKYSDQVWVVCEALQKYKKKMYKVDSVYIPNSSPFDKSFYIQGINKRSGNKMAWTGSCITERQFEMLFSVLNQIQNINSNIEFIFAPTGNINEFKKSCQKYNLKKWKVFELHSRQEWQKLAATCDVGIAIYDYTFGSTQFIEPLKIWDFMMCGLPFIISKEPSLSTKVKESGVAYVLDSKNTITYPKKLKDFLTLSNISSQRVKCLSLASQFDIEKKIKNAISVF